MNRRGADRRAVGAAHRAQVLDFVRTYIVREGYAPKTVEIAEAVGLSPNNTYNHVAALVRDGYLLQNPLATTNIGLADPAPDGWCRDAEQTELCERLKDAEEVCDMLRGALREAQRKERALEQIINALERRVAS
jgi:hypothetical protein